MWHGPFMGGFSFFMIFPVIFLIFFLFFLMARAGTWGFRGGCGGMRRTRMKQAPANTAREMLDQRYVRGEIDQAEYLKMKEDLS